MFSFKSTYRIFASISCVFLVLFIGVGKSCLLLQFTDKRFQPVHDLTIGKIWCCYRASICACEENSQHCRNSIRYAPLSTKLSTKITYVVVTSLWIMIMRSPVDCIWFYYFSYMLIYSDIIDNLFQISWILLLTKKHPGFVPVSRSFN